MFPLLLKLVFLFCVVDPRMSDIIGQRKNPCPIRRLIKPSGCSRNCWLSSSLLTVIGNQCYCEIKVRILITRNVSKHAFKYCIFNIFLLVHLYLASWKSTWISKLKNCPFVLKYQDSWFICISNLFLFFEINSKKADELKHNCYKIK